MVSLSSSIFVRLSSILSGLKSGEIVLGWIELTLLFLCFGEKVLCSAPVSFFIPRTLIKQCQSVSIENKIIPKQKKQAGIIRRTIIINDNFFKRIGLLKGTINGSRKELVIIIARNNNTGKRKFLGGGVTLLFAAPRFNHNLFFGNEEGH